MSRWFHLTLLSSCLYANAGAVCTLAGSLAWVLLNLVWLDAAAAPWVMAVTAVVLFSSTAFAMAFMRQNYNILGWMWFPLALYAVLTGQWVLAALAWVAASMASITVVFVAVPLMIVHALNVGRYEALLVLVPALLKLALHAVPMLPAGATRAATVNMAKMIGMTLAGVRYKRASMRLGLSKCVLHLHLRHRLRAALVGAFGASVATRSAGALRDEPGRGALRRRAVRHRDVRSVFAAHLMVSTPSIVELAALSIVANPMPIILGLCALERDRSLVRVQTRRPFDHTHLQAGLAQFIEGVPAGSTILVAFDDPRGEYERIFDGQRTLLDLPQFIAGSRSIHLFPDWHAVAETNFEGGPDFWGRSPQAVLDNSRRWRATHVIVGQSGTRQATSIQRGHSKGSRRSRCSTGASGSMHSKARSCGGRTSRRVGTCSRRRPGPRTEAMKREIRRRTGA